MSTADILPPEEAPLGFAPAYEPCGARIRVARALRLALGLLLGAAGAGVTIVVVVRALQVLWPSIFPTG